MALETELATYQAHLMELLPDNEGKYVVIKGQDILGGFDTYEAALEAGYDRHGPVAFLVRKVQASEPVHYFSRDFPRCQN